MSDKGGHIEDLTGLFIALCRAEKIPARTVWVPDYCYAEFYLEDADGKGYWFPCELKEKTVFGTVSNDYIIMQKGDNIKVPEKDKPYRLVPEFVEAKGTGRTAGDVCAASRAMNRLAVILWIGRRAAAGPRSLAGPTTDAPAAIRLTNPAHAALAIRRGRPCARRNDRDRGHLAGPHALAGTGCEGDRRGRDAASALRAVPRARQRREANDRQHSAVGGR